MAGGMAQVLENLPSKHEALSSNPQYRREKKHHLVTCTKGVELYCRNRPE
jgi:hypothetical protein